MTSQEMIRIPQTQNQPFYAQIVTKISTFALKKVHEQFLKVSKTTPKDLLQSCSRTFKSSMECQLYQERPSETENPLQQRWKEYNQQFNHLSEHKKAEVLNKMSNLFQESTVVVQNLQVQQTREHPVEAKNYAQSSTKRDPSTFELVEQGKRRKCGLCHEIGHNSRTCPNAKNIK
ncbi:hypothetical protein Glove_328g60 [Diversispora epigaea]|uniref:CCHC-type domain-containing protein n=1 Tax=Diversispora epigaea TaxID=1348612 RepID=A0A397HQ17_9GLOM|nr:hypothetical protein Glove_328g60 [Diversispora epigaea]